MINKKEAFELYEENCNSRDEVYNNLAQMLCETVFNSEISREAKAQHLSTRILVNSNVFSEYGIPNWDIAVKRIKIFGKCLKTKLEQYGYDVVVSYIKWDTIIVLVSWA